MAHHPAIHGIDHENGTRNFTRSWRIEGSQGLSGHRSRFEDFFLLRLAQLLLDRPEIGSSHQSPAGRAHDCPDCAVQFACVDAAQKLLGRTTVGSGIGAPVNVSTWS